MVNLKDKRKGVDVSYNASFFASLSWTFCGVYHIQMPQTHYKIINLKNHLWIKIANLNKNIY
jgi:hypothetical protein